MTFDFYTKASKFTVAENSVLKNGEVIAEGKVFLFQVLLGFPVYLIVHEHDFVPPVVIKTDCILSVLPSHEYFDGEREPQKFLYRVKYTINDVPIVYDMEAVDSNSAKTFVLQRYKNKNIKNVSVERKKRREKIS
ncbi:hypothetical protein [Anaerobacillus sp. 1_MG-2023]|uniref:hypothetical protein n=1 Tax=Anaerobacillus sp. 1_MG-2023 TaxID=3062655 RepID=UPI0026E27EF4|nr:hypothetical protein [Anaerobacillus sp. 1_MG-2023]MDO6657435.1 hypothetical protein [Anaerobacillus sp. 1_MG-2023]